MKVGLVSLLVSVLLLASCGDDVPDLTASNELSEFYFLPADGARFEVDSVVFDPVIDGIAQLASTTTWRFELIDSSASDRTYTVRVRDTLGRALGTQFWLFEETEAGLSHTYDGLTYLSIAQGADRNLMWDPLQFTDPNLQIAVAGEPVDLHKSWSAQLDSIGTYTLTTGESVEALFVSLASSENLLELREVNEVYGRGLGLLERRMRILDTQQTASSAPWEEKAERGFTLTMRRL